MTSGGGGVGGGGREWWRRKGWTQVWGGERGGGVEGCGGVRGGRGGGVWERRKAGSARAIASGARG